MPGIDGAEASASLRKRSDARARLFDWIARRLGWASCLHNRVWYDIPKLTTSVATNQTLNNSR